MPASLDVMSRAKKKKKKDPGRIPLQRRSGSRGPRVAFFSKARFQGLHHGDARELAKRLPPNSVSVTITSPPYFDLKDYGADGQIGYGQSYEAYLHDLTEVFKEVHRATRKRGSLWIVIDTFRREHEILPLPFDLATALKAVGWSLRDVIIWKKERTLPWIHEGKTKKIFEYILLFGKSGQTPRTYPDKLRDHTELRRWWVKYPERYNPHGKALEEIWDFDIPVQGSWGNDQIRHFCPLPPALVRRIIDLSTSSKTDVVLDPFAGSGTVLIEARKRGRRAVGFELNEKYIDDYRSHAKTYGREIEDAKHPNVATQKAFKALVLKLRALKFGRLLYKIFGASDKVEKIFLRPLRGHPIAAHKLQAVEYVLFGSGIADVKQLKRKVVARCNERPLSKFGIEPYVRVVRRKAELPRTFRYGALFGYSERNSHQYRTKLKLDRALASSFRVFSPLAIHVEEPRE